MPKSTLALPETLKIVELEVAAKDNPDDLWEKEWSLAGGVAAMEG